MNGFRNASRRWPVAILALWSLSAAAPLAANELALYLPFDGTAVDASGSGNGGTANNVSVVAGSVAAAYEFDGSSSYVSFPDLGFLNGNDSWTLMFWFKADDVTPSRMLIDLHGESKIVVKVSGGDLEAWAKVGDVWRVLGTPVQTGAWYHVAYSYDTASGTRLVVNNQEVDYDPATGAIPAEEDPGENRVGAYFRDNQYFDGVIDEVRIYRWD